MSSIPSPSLFAINSVSDWETAKCKKRKNEKTPDKKRRTADSASDSDEDSCKVAIRKLTADGDRPGEHAEHAAKLGSTAEPDGGTVGLV